MSTKDQRFRDYFQRPLLRQQRPKILSLCFIFLVFGQEALAQSKFESGEALPPMGFLMSVVIAAVLCGTVFMLALFCLMALGGELPWAVKAWRPVAVLNGIAVVLWAAGSLYLDSIFGIFAAGQFFLTGVLIYAGSSTRVAAVS